MANRRTAKPNPNEVWDPQILPDAKIDSSHLPYSKKAGLKLRFVEGFIVWGLGGASIDIAM